MLKQLSRDELIRLEERNEVSSVLEHAKQAHKEIMGLLPSEKAAVLAAIANLASSRPLMRDGKLNLPEFLHRVIRLTESSRIALSATSEKPRPHPEKGKVRSTSHPTPGAYSGTRREPSCAWHGELRS
jgi:hypothetical protein